MDSKKHAKKRSRKAAAPSISEDEAVDAAFADRAEALPPEMTGGAETFKEDQDRQPLASGGVKRGEALQVAEEEDDFEDGRSSGGIFTRSQEDQWARGDVGSRAVDTPSGFLSVGGSDGDPGPVEPQSVELPQRRSVSPQPPAS